MSLRKVFFTSIILFFSFSLSSCEEKPSYKTTGYAEADLFYLASPLGGYLKELSVHEGQSLSKDQKILKLDKQEFLKAPTKSKVVNILFQEDEYVPPGRPMVSLFIPNRMKIIFYVPEKNLKKIKLSKSISVLLDNKKYRVKINSIALQAEFTPDFIYSEQNRYKLVYKVKADASPELQSLLKIGQPVDIDYE